MIAANCVDKVISPYLGAEALASVLPFFKYRAEKGEIIVREVDEGIILSMLKAGSQGLPFLPWLGGIGTSIPELNPELKMIKCPFTGQQLIACPAIRPDISLIHAGYSDEFGNIRHDQGSYADLLLAQASKQTFAQVDKLMPNSEIKSNPEKTTIPSIYINGVVEVPYGAHPTFSPGHYLIDQEFIKKYLSSAKRYLSGEKEEFEIFMNKFIYSPQSQEQYLALFEDGFITALQQDNI